jgi:4-nitrophenyl phosphatase
VLANARLVFSKEIDLAMNNPPTPKALILDMDGVLWRGNQSIGNLPSIFSHIRALNMRFILATNNATRSIQSYKEKLCGFGVELESWQIINSAEATAHFLLKKFPSGGSVFIVGEVGLVQALADAGFHQSANDVLAVVAGLDREISYEKLVKATRLIRSGVLFVGTNPDRTYPMPDGLVPGAGAILACLQASSDVEPVIIGKPQPEMYKVSMERLGVLPEDTLVVGDRLETDIAGAQAIGCQTGLVLSGVSSERRARDWDPPIHYITNDLAELIRLFD